ncbi:MAG: UvrD-helicase domain-containing protein, partial [Clostridiales bacterium]|nr:UvrD-helicase domain-containing protein [Clostridiales bacterium]
MAFSLTEEQRAAVEDRGGGVLVSAAAGSGKTKVLVERLLRRVAEEGAQIDSFLVITYTRAAAAELRARVSAALSERLAERPGDAHLRRQLTLVYKAQISTVHAFCSALLKECGHLLDLAPDARLCDEGESRVLMAEALDRVMEARYEDLDPAGGFASLVDTMAAGRDDSRLMEIVLDIYGKIQSHPRPERWLARQRDVFALRDVEDVGKTPWGALLLEDTRRQAAYWQNRMSSALRRAEGDPKMEKAYAPSL